MTHEVAGAVADVYRREWGRVFACTVTLARDLDIAEECTQDAFVRALQTWPEVGMPDNPGAWLTTTARNRVAGRAATQPREGRRFYFSFSTLAAFAGVGCQSAGPTRGGGSATLERSTISISSPQGVRK